MRNDKISDLLDVLLCMIYFFTFGEDER